MAALHFTAANTTSLRLLTTVNLNPTKPNLIVSSSHASFPTKPRKRKNYLRKKILKTLPKSPIPQLPSSNPIAIDSANVIIEPDIIQEIGEFDKTENSEAGIEELEKSQELKEVEVSLPYGAGVDGNVGLLAKNEILKYGLWLVGAFLFQTLCAVWVFGSADFDDKGEIFDEGKKSSVLEVGGNGNGKIGVGNGGFLYVDELEMERKIEEIRVMAREVREKERLESKKSGLGNEESDDVDESKYSRSGIEEEVDNRLIKLKKKLENARDNTPVASTGVSRKGGLDEIDRDGALLYKKKYKFKGLSDDTREKPKGFVGSELSDVDSRGSNAVNALEDGQLKEMTESAANSRNKITGERGKEKQGKRNAAAKPTMSNGIALDKSGGRSVEVVQSRKLNGGLAKTRESSGTNIAVVSDKLSKGNGSSKGKGFGDAKLAKKSGSQADVWWSNLAHVMAILMRRGHNGEGGEGLYTLKSTSSSESHISHMVAFEDRVDATNFCYLLKSFFEDLEDFEADVVPLIDKELNEAVKSHGKRVIVVKKGQLQLYAGQPLADAEMALRALLKQV